LPENPLDQLVNHFGERNVAELTGRTRRLIRDSKTGHIAYKKRAPEGVAMDKANVYEMEQFQSGRKRVAIISDAASTGISLHASNRAGNRQRRVHLTLELGWSADKQMQTFGRTHRSDQAVPPEYVLLSTELGGEKRFSSTIARRLGSLGALTKGDRGAADSGDLAKYNFETEEGRAALSLLLRRMMKGQNVPNIENPRQVLRDMGLFVIREGAEEIRKEDEYDVPRFLNRVLALDVERQNSVFDAFAEIFDQTVGFAKANGTFDEGVTDIKALSIRLNGSPQIVFADPITGAQTTHYTLDVDRPAHTVSFEEADRARRMKTGAFLRHNKKGHVILAIPSQHRTDPKTGTSFQTFAVWRPEGERTDYLNENEVNRRYTPIPTEEARDWWRARHAEIPQVETFEMHIIGGAILPLWQRLKTREGTQLRVVRVSTDAGGRIVGVWIPREQVRSTLRALGVGCRLQTPEEIFQDVMEGGEVSLTGDLRLKQGSLHGEAAIELCGATPYKFAQLREMGLINEQVNWKQRFFVPTDEAKGIEILKALLHLYPAIAENDTEPKESPDPADDLITAESVGAGVIDLIEWIIPVGEIGSVGKEPEDTPPPTSPETLGNHEPSNASPDFLTESAEPAARADLLLFPKVPTGSKSPGRGKHSDREALGQFAFDFGEAGDESNDAAMSRVG
jgi:hypothetical protein